MRRCWVCGVMLVLAVVLAGSVQAGQIVASASPDLGAVKPGQEIQVPVIIDMTGMPEKLGSFTGKLQWDPNVLRYLGYRAGANSSFRTLVVNSKKTSRGQLIFAGANPYGAEGKAEVLNVTFKVVGKIGSSSPLQLTFSAMAAAYTFHNLLPYVRSTTTGVDQSVQVGEIPKEFGLSPNYPNPFNPSTEIVFQLPRASRVELVVYNQVGQKIRTLVDGRKRAGRYAVKWDGRDDQGRVVPGGIYVCKMVAGEFRAHTKMLFLR